VETIEIGGPNGIIVGLKPYLNQITSYLLTDFIFYIVVCDMSIHYSAATLN
jgi:hypothetical protein